MTDALPNARITSRQDLNEELAIFRVQPDNWELPSFLPGQYAELAIVAEVPIVLPDGKRSKLERRSYSIASPPSHIGELEFYIVKVEGGFLTPQLWTMSEGSRLWLGPKIKGKFTLEEVPQQQDLVMVSTGTGLAPFVSMLREYGSNPPWRRVVLIHGARYERDLGYRQEFENLANSVPWFYYLPSLTREPESSSWRGERGRIQKLFENKIVEQALGHPVRRDDTHILLCGNPQMIDEVEALLGTWGLHLHKKKNPGNIHVERYW